MAITRRQFVAGMSALAASMGFNSAQIAKITEALAAPTYAWPFGPGRGYEVGTPGELFGNKPKVIWVHGAECTGCTVSTLSLFEDARATIDGTDFSTLGALGLTRDTTIANPVPRTFVDNDLNVDKYPTVVNIQDILVDWLNVEYLETAMAMGGDTAYEYLRKNMDYDQSDGLDPFVLVVEGATQDKDNGGAWQNFPGDATHKVPWCSVGMPDEGMFEDDLSFDDVVRDLATRADCAAVISYGQCASFGGYPAAISPAFVGNVGPGGAPALTPEGGNQTGAQGTFDFLVGSGAEGKVINVPGCPPNPWWLVLTVVAWLVDFAQTERVDGAVGPLGILKANGTGALDVAPNAPALDYQRRLKVTYPYILHSSACPYYSEYVKGNYATTPGDDGCMLLMGCKGPSTNSLCFARGWSGQQPGNVIDGVAEIDDYNVPTMAHLSRPAGKFRGGNCIVGGHPCMACTEKGYPDRYVPFVNR